MGFSLKSKGDYSKTKKFLENNKHLDLSSILETAGKQGLARLSAATPEDTGRAASSWNYEVEIGRNSSKVIWTNDDVTSRGDPIVLLIQYGHGTRNGGYVQPNDFINPAMQSLFNDIADTVWKEMTS